MHVFRGGDTFLINSVDFMNEILYNTINSTINNTIYLESIMSHITANELKTQGVSSIERGIEKDDEAIITVRGKNKYVVININRYNYLRECELEAALRETKKQVASGEVIHESVDNHIKRISHGL